MAAGEERINPSVFADPSSTGERALRRYLLEVTRETANLQILHDTYTQTDNSRYKTQVNAARANLEQATNALRTTTDAPVSMVSRIAAAITAADDVLTRIEPLDESEGPLHGAPTPSVSLLNMVDAPNSAFRPIVPPHCQPNAQDANGVAQTQNSDSDQGLRDILASPLLPATPALRSAVGDGHGRPKSHDGVVNHSASPAPREVERAASVLSSGSRHQDAAIAIGSARQERLNARQGLRRKL